MGVSPTPLGLCWRLSRSPKILAQAGTTIGASDGPRATVVDRAVSGVKSSLPKTDDLLAIHDPCHFKLKNLPVSSGRRNGDVLRRLWKLATKTRESQ